MNVVSVVGRTRLTVDKFNFFSPSVIVWNPFFSFSCQVVGSCAFKRSVPVKTEDSPGILVEERENVPHSPESTIVPETPDSLIKPSHNSGVHYDVTCSPVSRSPSSRGLAVKNNLFARKPMRPLQNESPKAKDQDNWRSDCSRGGSVKRRMFSPDELQRVKRVRPMPVKRPSQSPLKEPGSSAANGLHDYLEEIRCLKSTVPKIKPGQNAKQAPNLLKAGQIVFLNDSKSGHMAQDTRKEEKALGENKFSTKLSKASSSHSNKSNVIGDASFTLISEPKPFVDHDLSRVLSTNGELVCSFTCDVPDESELTLPHPSKGGNADKCHEKDRYPNGKATLDDLQEELDDSWFDDKMEPSTIVPKEKPSKSE